MALGLVGVLAQRERLSNVGGTPEGEAGAGGRALRVIGLTAAIMALVVLCDRPGWQWLRWLFLAAPVVAAIVCGFSADATWTRLGGRSRCFSSRRCCSGRSSSRRASTIALFCDQLTRAEVAGWSFPSSWFQVAEPALRDRAGAGVRLCVDCALDHASRRAR